MRSRRFRKTRSEARLRIVDAPEDRGWEPFSDILLRALPLLIVRRRIPLRGLSRAGFPHPRRVLEQFSAILLIGVLLLGGGMLLTACGNRTPVTTPVSVERAGGPPALSAVPLEEGEKLRVVATTSIVADVVRNVGGDRIELRGLLPVSVDPHAYEPTPQDLRAVTDAHVIFANGVGLEAFLDEMLRNAGSEAPVIPVSQGIDLLTFGVDVDIDVKEEQAEHLAEADPHTWFDPNNVIIWVHNIEAALSALDPANAPAYQSNAQAYAEKLKALDAWIREQVAQIPPENRKLVTDHQVLGYFAHAYGFEMIGAVIEAYSAAAEPSAQELAALEERIRQYRVPAIFVGKTVNPKLVEQIARDTGIKLVPLYTGSLSAAGGEADTYLAFMRYNVSAIVTALKP